jgi:SAM-dependent methyltransferase
LGCGTGTNAVLLATRGFEVTAVDISPTAVELARERAAQAGVAVRFLSADVLQLPDLGEPFPFVLDRGTYHTLRDISSARSGYLRILEHVTAAGGQYLAIQPNANEVDSPDVRVRRIHDYELCLEFSPLFHLIQLREFRFDHRLLQGKGLQPLGWSALFRRKENPE